MPTISIAIEKWWATFALPTLRFQRRACPSCEKCPSCQSVVVPNFVNKLYWPRSIPLEGRLAIATNAGWNAMAVSCVAWRATWTRTAKARGPDTLVAGVKPAGRDSAGDGDTKAGLAGARTIYAVNTIVQGMSMFRLHLR